jgi:cysteinyl-tRNA synthetase
MPIHLYNSLTKQKEVFRPKKPGHVSMYHCGPTVYNYAHIGNLRAYIAADILRRTFELNDYNVTQVMNITDIGHLQHDEIDAGDDKMTLALRREGKELTRENMEELALRFYDAFRADIEKVNILPANLFPFASKHIAEDISFIQKLMEKNNAYATDDGVYFDTTSLPDYGKLGGISLDNASTESRIGDDEIARSEKRNPRDFALWKFNDDLGYEAPFGKGFPGWHIECSVMSMKYLGGLDDTTTNPHWNEFETFDIHTGGVDHIPVHHNNEIAQTEAITQTEATPGGMPLANYWLHNAHLIIEGGKKMAKSGEAFITLETLEKKGISPLGFRYWTLGASYRTPLQFSWEALGNAETAYRSLIGKISDWKIRSNIPEGTHSNIDQADEKLVEYVESFKSLLNDDLNTPQAIAFLHEKIISDRMLPDPYKIKMLDIADDALGLQLMEKSDELASDRRKSADVPSDISDLAEKRKTARAEKNWAESDRIRDEIASLGYEIKDTNDVETGYIVTKKLI